MRTTQFRERLDETKGHFTPNDEVVFGKQVKNWTQYFSSQEVRIHPLL